MAAKRHPKKKRQKTSFLIPYALLSSCIIFILAGAGLLFAASSRFLVFSQTSQTSQNQPVSSQKEILPKPVKIYIPKISRLLAISDGQVVDNRWTISETGVSYLTTSTVPGNFGNSIIYGHNRSEILGNLVNLGEGDFIYIVLSDGTIAKFQVFETKEIEPTQVDILAETADKRLTVYTCSGFLDQSRFVVVGKLI